MAIPCINRQRVREHARRRCSTPEREAQREAEFLDSALWLTSTLRLADDGVCADLFEKLGLVRCYKKEVLRRSLAIVVANLLQAQEEGRPVAAPLGLNDWKKTRYTPLGYEVRKIILSLERAAMIYRKRGYRFKRKSRYSRIWASDRLCSRLAGAEVIPHPAFELVVLRDDEGEPRQYSDDAFTDKLRRDLQRINEVNGFHRITYRDENGAEKVILPYLHAVFNGSWRKGGRFYGSVRSHQGIKKGLRPTIRMDGGATVELDFSSLHPRMLYALKGIQRSENLYACVSRRRGLQRAIKAALLRLINAASETQAEQSLFRLFYETPLDENKAEYEAALMILGHDRPIKKLTNMIKAAHPRIAHFFGAGIGLRLQNRDARIARQILVHFVQRGKPCLPLHDSFIVKAGDEAELRSVMRRAYGAVMGSEYSCPVKKDDPLEGGECDTPLNSYG